MTATPAEWERILGSRLEYRVSVKFGRARTQPVRAVFERGELDLRLHEFFATAPTTIADDMAAWLRSGRRARGACTRLDQWIDEQLASLPRRAPRNTPRRETQRTDGDVHDLDALAASLFADEFRGDFLGDLVDRPRPVITWGRRGKSRARRSLQLGCYVRESHLVRMHTILDQPAVPEWFVRFVLFHEILHGAMPVGVRPHGPEFRARERTYHRYADAIAWQARNIDRLIRSARSGKPMRGDARPRRGVQGLFFRL